MGQLKKDQVVGGLWRKETLAIMALWWNKYYSEGKISVWTEHLDRVICCLRSKSEGISCSFCETRFRVSVCILKSPLLWSTRRNKWWLKFRKKSRNKVDGVMDKLKKLSVDSLISVLLWVFQNTLVLMHVFFWRKISSPPCSFQKEQEWGIMWEMKE